MDNYLRNRVMEQATKLAHLRMFVWRRRWQERFQGVVTGFLIAVLLAVWAWVTFGHAPLECYAPPDSSHVPVVRIIAMGIRG